MKHTSSYGSSIPAVVGILYYFIYWIEENYTLLFEYSFFQFPRPVNHNMHQNTLKSFLNMQVLSLLQTLLNQILVVVPSNIVIVLFYFLF